jgi:predicted PurR-regulated permease PerM
VSFSRWRRHGGAAPSTPAGEAADARAADAGPAIDREQLANLFEAPVWLRRLGIQAWLLVGIAVLLVGLVWILGLTATIVIPVVTGGVIAAVASPGVAALQRRGVPRIGGAAVILLALMAVAVLVIAMVLGGIVAQSSEIESSASQALDTIEGWLNDAGSGSAGTAPAAESISSAVTSSGGALIQGVMDGIEQLTSLAFFLSFTAFSVFFLLKDGPTIRRWANRHLGVPVPLANVITGRVVESLRHYFLGVTIVAAFNGVVVWLGALILGVPLAGTIGIVTFAAAYVPFIGAFVSGTFAVVLTLGSQGTTDALIMIVIVVLANGLLQNIVQPVAFGATLDLNPLAVLILTIGGGCLFGMVGMILAAPLASAAVHVSRDLASARLDAGSPPRPGVERAEAEQPSTG